MGYARGLTPWLWNLRKLLRLKLYLPPRVRGPAPPRLPVDVPPVAAPVRPVDALAEALQRVRDKLDLVGWLYLYKLGLSLLTKRSCFRHVHDMKLFKPKASKAEIPYVYPILLTGLITSEGQQPDQQETQVKKHDRSQEGIWIWLLTGLTPDILMNSVSTLGTIISKTLYYLSNCINRKWNFLQF